MGKVLIACEESQAVCKAFRARGHEAYSCDIQAPSGGHPEWHILFSIAILFTSASANFRKNAAASYLRLRGFTPSVNHRAPDTARCVQGG